MMAHWLADGQGITRGWYAERRGPAQDVGRAKRADSGMRLVAARGQLAFDVRICCLADVGLETGPVLAEVMPQASHLRPCRPEPQCVQGRTLADRREVRFEQMRRFDAAVCPKLFAHRAPSFMAPMLRSWWLMA